jgi:hypothetical protein
MGIGGYFRRVSEKENDMHRLCNDCPFFKEKRIIKLVTA